jgi:hypothetical protein
VPYARRERRRRFDRFATDTSVLLGAPTSTMVGVVDERIRQRHADVRAALERRAEEAAETRAFLPSRSRRGRHG